MTELVCQRCKKPLVGDVAIPGHDGRLICSRGSCQYVEEMSRRIDEGTFELVDQAEFAVEVTFPTGLPPVELDTHMEAVLIRPIPSEPPAPREEGALARLEQAERIEPRYAQESVMTKDKIHDDLAAIIEEWASCPARNLTPETDLSKILDSFDVLDIVMDVEEDFGIQIHDEEAMKIRTMAEAVDLIESRLQADGRA